MKVPCFVMGFKSGICLLIAPVPVHCFSITFLSKNKKSIKNFHLKIIIFTALKNRSVLHGHVFVMVYSKSVSDS